jgi:hypothetical protein
MNGSSGTGLLLRKNHLIPLLSKSRFTVFLVWAILFSLVYAQSPLFTSNQNQYYLHGFARAGYGLLNEDWLANTADSTPIFSWLVFLTVELFRTNLVFYLYYALLMGVYLFSLIGITIDTFALQKKNEVLFLITLILIVHSAAWRFLFSRLVGPEANYLFEGGVAGQRVLGAVLQPSSFGVLLILSIYFFVKDRVTWQ